MAKTAKFKDKLAIVAVLKQIDEVGQVKRLASPISYYLLRQLVAQGYLNHEDADSKAARGRLGKKYVVSGKGRGLIGLSKGWGKKGDGGTAGEKVAEAA